MVLIHGSVTHRSERNLSQKSRFIYTFHLIDSTAQYDELNWFVRSRHDSIACADERCAGCNRRKNIHSLSSRFDRLTCSLLYHHLVIISQRRVKIQSSQKENPLTIMNYKPQRHESITRIEFDK